jgi:hypothetical protein
VGRRDGARIHLASWRVNDSFNTLENEINTQLSERGGGKMQAAAGKSVLVASLSFSVLAVYATRGAAVKMRMAPVKAVMAGNGFAAAMQSATNELGKVLNGSRKGLGDAALSMTMDTAMVVLTGELVAKLPKALVDKVASKSVRCDRSWWWFW